MNITDLKKQLNGMEKKELINLIGKLYKASQKVQSIIDVELCGESVEKQFIADCKKFTPLFSVADFH